MPTDKTFDIHERQTRDALPPLEEGRMRFELGLSLDGGILFRAPELDPGAQFIKLSPVQALTLAGYLVRVAEAAQAMRKEESDAK